MKNEKNEEKYQLTVRISILYRFRTISTGGHVDDTTITTMCYET